MRSLVCGFCSLGILVTIPIYAEISSANYVSGGLVAHWDGIDNTLENSVRSHKADATVWCDLTGNKQNLDLPSFITVEEKSLYSKANINKSETIAVPKLDSIVNLNSWTNTEPYTIEIVIARGPWTYTDNYFNLQTVISTPRGTVGYRQNLSNGLYYQRPVNHRRRQLNNWMPNGVDVTQCHTFSLALGNGTWGVASTLAYDQNNAFTLSGNDYEDDWGSGFTFFSNKRVDIRVYAIRIYNRLLTTYERKRNALLDEVRFKGVSQVPFLIKPYLFTISP